MPFLMTTLRLVPFGTVESLFTLQVAKETAASALAAGRSAYKKAGDSSLKGVRIAGCRYDNETPLSNRTRSHEMADTKLVVG
jgi:hypothetical protein